MTNKYDLNQGHFRSDESDMSKLAKITLTLAAAIALSYGGFKCLSNPSPIIVDPNTISKLEEKAQTQIKSTYVKRDGISYWRRAISY